MPLYETVADYAKKTLQTCLSERRYSHVHDWFVLHFKKDSGYDRRYFDTIEHNNGHCYQEFANVLVDLFGPQKVVDIGCGTGGVMQAFANLDCEVHGYDGSSASVRYCHERGLSQVQKLNLTKAQNIPARGDLAISLEVAEHLPERFAANYCRLLASVAPICIMTAARPGQTGHLHLNEQPQSYWNNLLKRHDMNYDSDMVGQIKERYSENMIRDYRDNLMVFRRRRTADGNGE